MSDDSQVSVKGEVAIMPSPSGSASSQDPPLSPSTASKPPELPDELVQAGWSKCWSRRENRPYYFNRFTNQSLWEVPVLGQHDVISDPLGLNAPSADGGDSNGQRKRRMSEEQGAGPNSIKRVKQSRLVYCYPVRLALPSPPLPRVELHFENDVACLRFRGEMVKVNRGHFSKLVSGAAAGLLL
ncbi:Phosphorylated CTD-interacting factor 1 [Liparis tanakae]|uniref:Phosphorylated CTD-interacting factor 1 n=1 Tax=Liparis tanakae TaxID=230148 RepID=A0A4Z2EWW0_9TELE|nr:Phosphorylated CTD-interacting factor 1 [Liparis tanakae]